jgi:hypothetical protein
MFMSALPVRFQTLTESLVNPFAPAPLRHTQAGGGPTASSVLSIIEQALPIRRRLLRHGDVLYGQGQMMTLCTLPTQARVAQFLCYWVQALEARQLRTDHITLRLSREEIGSHLGMTLESVSRSLSQLSKRDLV